MRASRQEQVASTGINEVSASFDRLGWGTAENTRHDLGTDLFVQARDVRLSDLGLVIGVQVKTGSSYFAEPARATQDTPAGWWFRDRTKKHTDFWLSHGLPHLIVLHDEQNRRSYWAHVVRDAVINTGKGAKMLVPERNTLDCAHLDELLAVAGTGRAAVPLEGTAWTGAVPPAMKDQLRFALVVPRLVAPHPNASREAGLTAVQATALLMQARLNDLQQYAASFTNVPSLQEARTADTWAWRFVGALGDRIMEGTLDAMRAARDDAPDLAARVACTVIIASSLIEDGHIDPALDLLDAALQPDDASPLDDAWLRVQRARALVEVGRDDEARRDASAVQAVRSTSRHEVTATAMSGIAAILLFNTASWSQGDVASVIEGADTAAAWWREQTTSRGVTAIAERTFKRWARDASVTLGGSDEANNQLFVAGLVASHLGDHGAWRHLSGLLGRDSLLRLDRRAAPELAASGLSLLRRAGDENAVGLATRRLVDNGPAAAVTLAGADVSLAQSTRTTVLADLALLRCGADVLDEPTARNAVEWLLVTLDDPTRLAEITSSRVY